MTKTDQSSEVGFTFGIVGEESSQSRRWLDYWLSPNLFHSQFALSLICSSKMSQWISEPSMQSEVVSESSRTSSNMLPI